jgi:putative ABC transport system ATP-binding protein
MIDIRGVTICFNQGTPDERRALDGISLSIPQGQFVTVIGSNGAGKSTLLNTLSGDLRPLEGQVLIDGIDVTAWPGHRRAPLVARVFQDPLAGTCDTLTVEENLALAASRGITRGLGRATGPALRARAREQLARLGLGLEDRLNDRIGLLSGGQRQVVSLVMAAMMPMKLLLLDEHTAALDPRTAQFVLRLTDEIVGRDGLTTMMVTHSMRQALDHGSRTLMMHEGRIALDVAGEARAGMDVPDLLALFGRARAEMFADDALLLA